MRQVVRQDQQRFDQRPQQAGNDDQRDDPHDLAHRPGHVQQRNEGRHRGQDREDHRRRDLACALDRSFEALTGQALAGIDVLADDDRIVHDDTQDEDEGEQRHHVDRHVEQGHDPEGAHERDEQSHCDPERQPESKEQRKADEDERKTGDRVTHKQVTSAPQYACAVVPGCQPNAVRHAKLRLAHVLFDRCRDRKSILVADAEDLDQLRGLAVEARGLVGVLETVDHRGHVAEPQVRSVPARQQDQFLEVATDVGLPFRSQQDLPGVRLDRAAGKVEARAAHGAREIVEGQLVPTKHVLRDLDRDLVGPGIGDLHDRDSRKSGEIVPDLFGQVAQCLLVGVTRDGDVDDLAAVAHFGDDRFLGLEGKGVDRIDPRLDVVENFRRDGVLKQLHRHHAEVLRCDGGDFLDAVQSLNRFFDADADALLDFGRCGPAIEHADRDEVQGELGEDLLPDRATAKVRGSEWQPPDGDRATGDDHHRHQVGRDVVLREPGDRVHPSTLVPSGVRPCSASSPKIRTRMPLVTADRLDRQTRSPSLRPEPTIAWSSLMRNTTTSRN